MAEPQGPGAPDDDPDVSATALAHAGQDEEGLRPEEPDACLGAPRVDVGEHAPEAVLIDPGRGEVLLSSHWSERPAVVVFLRYFGCPFCQVQVVGLRDDRQRFEEAGGGIVLVGQGDPDEVARFIDAKHLPFPCFVDPDRAAYSAYGLIVGGLRQIFTPSAASPFIRAQLRTETRQRGFKGGSFFQMPGTFVVDTNGILWLAHRNKTIADSPSNPAVLDVLRSLRHVRGPQSS